MSRALVLGAVFVDIVVDVPQLPLSGEDATGEMVASHVGGCAYNVYGAIRAAGQAATLFVPVGVGQYADVVRADFAHKQVPVKLPLRLLLYQWVRAGKSAISASHFDGTGATTSGHNRDF